MSLRDFQRRIGVQTDGVWGPLTEKRANDLIPPQLTKPTPEGPPSYEDFIAGYIDAHEGGLSLDPRDNGNWYSPERYAAGQPQRRNLGQLVGSKYGVTAYALARYLGTSVITPEDIKSLTREQAIKLGVTLFVKQPGFDKLPWNRVTASIIDKGWGSGPTTAIKLLQRMLGVADDGKIGPATIGSYNGFLNVHGEDGAAHLWAEQRIDFDTALTMNDGVNDPDKAFINGWNNRTRSFLPGTPWWNSWS